MPQAEAGMAKKCFYFVVNIKLMKDVPNPIDDKVERILNLLSTSKTVWNLIILICILGILFGIYGILIMSYNATDGRHHMEAIYFLGPFGLIIPASIILNWAIGRKKKL